MYQYARTSSMDRIIAVLNDPNGQFAINDNINLFAYNANGITLANSQNPNAMGNSVLNTRGSYNLRYINEMVNLASQGWGYICYYTKADGLLGSDLSMFTIAYLLPADNENTWFIGTSHPIRLVKPGIATRDRLKLDVIALHQSILKHGKDALLDPEIISQMENGSFPALDYNGNVLAFPSNISMVGKNIFGFTDSNGVSSIHQMVILAKQGGWHRLTETLGSEGVHEINLVYVKPVDDTWCIATGVTIDSYFRGDEE